MSTKQTNLILLTSNFPFGPGESFIDYEIPYLMDYFNRVVIVASNVSHKQQKRISDDIKVHRLDPRTSLIGWLKMPILVYSDFKHFSSLYREELQFRQELSQSLNWKQKLWIIKRIFKAIEFKGSLLKIMDREKMGHGTLLYSYWFNTAAHAIGMIDLPGIYKIARGHGSDLYEYVNKSGLHPLHHNISRKLDGLFFISAYGKAYFEELTKSDGRNTYLSRLGISTIRLEREKQEVFTIVSCSNVNRIKRLHLIIESLKKLPNDRHVQWIHFGDGPLMQQIRETAKASLENLPNITFHLKGEVSNEALHIFYATNTVDLIINVSESEGIPVSLMEAQAYGIPAIATDVGGTREIINEKTGFLLPANFEINEIVILLGNFMELDNKHRSRFREQCLKNREEKFSAATNFSSFIQTIDQKIIH